MAKLWRIQDGCFTDGHHSYAAFRAADAVEYAGEATGLMNILMRVDNKRLA